MNYFEDLIVVGKEKLAIFNKTTCEFITDKIYDQILLSPSGNHILMEIQKEDTLNQLYSIMDNSYRITKYPNLIFKNQFIGSSAIAFEKNLEKTYLVNNNGEIISEGFDYIEHLVGNLYQTHALSANKRKIEKVSIINTNGESLPFTFSNIDTQLTLYANELQTLEDLIKNIEKYGVEVTHISNFIPISTTELLIIINSVINNINTKNKNPLDIFYLVSAYKNVINYKTFNIDLPKSSFNIDLSFSNINKIELNNIKKEFINQLIEPIYK